MRYRLERRDGAPQGSSWWFVGGTAVHEAIREWETKAALFGGTAGPPSADWAAERFGHHLAEATAAEVLARGVPLTEWRAGGRATKQYPNKEDRSWWLDNGPEMVAKYVLAQEGRESEILRIDSEALALELGFMLRLGDLPPVKGFIDQVLYFPQTDAVLIRDIKAGAQTPVDTLQLKVYRLALTQCFGIQALSWWGDYWDARKGEPTRGVDLKDLPKVAREVAYRVRTMDTAERAGLYLPNPGSNCSACGVKAHCPAMSDSPTASWEGPRRALDAPLAH